MPTYRLSARSQLRTPSGAVGDPPDGPGGMAALSDDVDNFLGVGGAEYAANAAAMTAIPAGRLFKGKLVYRADTDTVYRYVGVGGTALGSGDSTSKWQAWHKPATNFTPAFSSGLAAGATLTASTWAQWGITAGRFWMDELFAFTAAGWSAAADLAQTLPSPVVGQTAAGAGLFQPAGASASGSTVDLRAYTVQATPGALSTAMRIRVPRANSATSPQNVVLVTPNTAFGTGAALDTMQLSISAPSALVG